MGCRAEVDKVYKHRAELKRLGVRMAVALRENLPEEVEAFREDVWKEESIYLDSSFALFGAIAGGTPNEADPEKFMAQFGLYAEGKAEGYMDEKHHNTVGEGLMTGGIYVLRKGGEVQWAFHEKNVGHTADAADVLAAAKEAAVSREADNCCRGDCVIC